MNPRSLHVEQRLRTRIHPTAIVDPSAEIGRGVVIGPYAIVEGDARIGRETVIDAHAFVGPHTVLGERNRLHHGAVVGSEPQDLKFSGDVSYTVVGDGNTFREYSTVNRGTTTGEVTRIGNGCFVMAYAHVAHGCEIGNSVILANSVNLAGHVVLEDHVVIGGLSGVHQFVRMGAHAMVGGCSRVTQDVATYALVAGSEVRVAGVNVVGLRRRGFKASDVRAIKAAYRVIFRSNLTLDAAIDRLRSEEPHPVVLPLIEFLANGERGFIR